MLGAEMAADGREQIDIAGAAVRPPRLHLVAIAAGLTLDWLLPARLAEGGLSFLSRTALGGWLIGGGVGLFCWALARFRAADTPVPTVEPTRALVTDGPYRVSRNPIYLALALVHAGIAVALDNAWILVLLAPTMIVIRYGVIAREELYLERKFGESYLAYKARVRRWL
jgi:protein-S-isoprenylcysteine O-methyltransferase Ste14